MVVVFNDHATKITEVAKLSCFMSNNCEGVKMVRFAASQTENLCPQVKIFDLIAKVKGYIQLRINWVKL